MHNIIYFYLQHCSSCLSFYSFVFRILVNIYVVCVCIICSDLLLAVDYIPPSTKLASYSTSFGSYVVYEMNGVGLGLRFPNCEAPPLGGAVGLPGGTRVVCMRDIYILNGTRAQDKIYTYFGRYLVEIFYLSVSTGTGFEL
jgi:hypothetical protein